MGTQMVPGKAAMTTITIVEAYFQLRAGMWTDDDLEAWVQDRIDAVAQDNYDQGYKSGYEEGLEDGAVSMYKQALEAVKCLA